MGRKREVIPMIRTALCLTIGCALGPVIVAAEVSEQYVPKNFQRAYANGTRSPDGRPGPGYWQNRADYELEIELEPKSRWITGRGTITYFNNSPDELLELVFHLFPNLYAAGAARDYEVQPDDLTSGMVIQALAIAGAEVDTSPDSEAVELEGTTLTVVLHEPLPSQGSLEVSVSWQSRINRDSHLRDGAVDASSLFSAYFFPRIAVNDDIDGWNRTQYTGTTEFYNDFGDFEVDITIPGPFIVWATGTLQNPEAVLSPHVLHRYRSSFTSDEIVHVVDAIDLAEHRATLPNTTNTWRFAAKNVSDFAFATSDHYLWDATSVEVDTSSSRRVRLDAAYPEGSSDFDTVAGIAREAVHFMSFDFPGIAFPYPELSVFQGLADMEYPMMVNDSASEVPERSVQLTSHEIFHTYFPFLTGMNETRYAWMDEGLACLGDYLFTKQQGVQRYRLFWFHELYENEIGHDLDSPIFVRSDVVREPAYLHSSYSKAAAFFLALRDLIGEDDFTAALRTFIQRWSGRHPLPHDLFATIEAVTGQDLQWFIRPWFFEFGVVDLAIAEVSHEEGKYRIVIERKGRYPAPINLRLTFLDGSTESLFRTAAVWKNGESLCTIEYPGPQTIVKAELPDESLLDADTTNNTFSVP